jgi:ATP-dependent DNA helicase RecQ
VLKGEVEVLLRQPPARKRKEKAARGNSLGLSAADTELFDRLREWRRKTAQEHDVPAYVIFHDATLREMAQTRPASLSALGDVSGVGARKLEAYGESFLAVIRQH